MGETQGPACHFCDICDGHGCIGELPGMGGVYENTNFIENCSAWKSFVPDENSGFVPTLRLAPVTGAIQNAGYPDERQFYHDLITASRTAGLALSIGDGYPDEKLRYGIEALEASGEKGAVFIKPYDNSKILERMEWAASVTEIVGVDIDSYAIVTMRNLVNLQQKNVAQLRELKDAARAPFAVKGIFKKDDIALVRELKPDIVVISNHGGRVETERGSTAAFLAAHGRELSSLCGELWVDGGIRNIRDLRVAGALGARTCMIARPVLTALLAGGVSGVRPALAPFFAK